MNNIFSQHNVYHNVYKDGFKSYYTILTHLFIDKINNRNSFVYFTVILYLISLIICLSFPNLI